MSARNQPYHRYQIINACLTNKRKPNWTKRELIEEIKKYDFLISERTLNTDIGKMRDDTDLKFFAPIVYKNNRGYFYEDPNYSINAIQFNDEQRRAFFSVIHLLEPYKNFKIVHEFKGTIEKILRVVDELTKQTKPSSSVIEFEKSALLCRHRLPRCDSPCHREPAGALHYVSKVSR